MPLNKEQFQQIQDALLDGYNEFSLRQMVRLRLDEALDRIAGGSNLEERVFNLVEWADRTGRERELVEEAYSHNPTNPALQKLHDAWFVLQPAADLPGASEANPPQIFLSYSRKDSAQMQQVLRLLEGAGLSVWTDEGLEPGTERWQSAIEEAIHRTECTVVLLSPDAKQSRWIGIEVSFAQALGRRIFPVLLRGVQVESVPLSLFDAQYLDGRQYLADAVSQRLLPALRRYLNLVGTASSDQAAAEVPAVEVMDQTRANGISIRDSASSSPRQMRKLPVVIDWITVPAGEFMMGSDKNRDKDANDDELPQHRLTLPAYRIARRPVTVAQYKTFVKASGYYFDRTDYVNTKPDHPITHVSWHGAKAFCEWLSNESGQEIRLPTEAEWEKAARGTDGRIYPWGDEAPRADQCNFARNFFHLLITSTTSVDAYPLGASPYGCLDMAGNVWEWTSSKYKDYQYDETDGREDPDTRSRRVLRGGSLYSYRQFVRCAYRNSAAPDDRGNYFGFRVLSPGS